MPCGTYSISGIPNDKLGEVLAGVNLDMPLKVDQKKAADGTWTVTATYPPCPPGQSQTTTKQYPAT